MKVVPYFCFLLINDIFTGKEPLFLIIKMVENC